MSLFLLPRHDDHGRVNIQKYSEIKHATANLGETSVKYRCIFVTSQRVGLQNCVFFGTRLLNRVVVNVCYRIRPFLPMITKNGGVGIMQPHITYSTCTWLQLNGPKLDLDTQRWRKGPLLRIHSPWLSNKHRIQGLLSLLLFLKYFSSLQISFLWPGGCSGRCAWRWRFTALGEIQLIFMICIVFPRTKSFSPKGITGFALAPRGKFIIGIIEQHLPETDFFPRFYERQDIFQEIHREHSLRVTLGATSREHCDTGRRRRRQSWVHADTWIKV